MNNEGDVKQRISEELEKIKKETDNGDILESIRKIEKLLGLSQTNH